MSTITTPTREDIDVGVRRSILSTLTDHFTMDRAKVESCLDGAEPDIRIASRRAIVVIARVQKAFGVTDLVDVKKLRPEQVTSVKSVANGHLEAHEAV